MGGSNFVKRNLRDVDDMAAQGGFSEHQEARFPRTALGAEQTGFNHLVVKPGQREAFAHRHQQAEEIYFVLSGSGSVKLDEQVVPLSPMDMVRVGPGVGRCFAAGDEPLEVLIFGPRVEDDAEMLSNFWDED